MDADAAAFIAAREAAQSAYLFDHIKAAIDKFVVGCKADPSPVSGVSNWEAFRVCNLLAGAANLAGALVPLVGPPQVNSNFIWQDYIPTFGLKGDGATKHIDTGIQNTSIPNDMFSMGCWISERTGGTGIKVYMGVGSGTAGGTSHIRTQDAVAGNIQYRNRSGGGLGSVTWNGAGVYGHSRQAIDANTFISPTTYGTSTTTAGSTLSGTHLIFAASGPSPSHCDARLAFYWIGESVDLISLRSRISRYMIDIAASSRRGFPMSRLVN